MNRGSKGATKGTLESNPRFNEAPIHESGKYRAARIHAESRLASMRPRFMNRGSLGKIVQEQEIICGFNEAPIHESGK